MGDPYAIEGTGEPETRLDIDVFSTNPEYKVRWDLFLRGLAVVQSAPPADPMGFYRIAGIYPPVFYLLLFLGGILTYSRDSRLANRHLAET